MRDHLTSRFYMIDDQPYRGIEGFPHYAINHTGKIVHLSKGEVKTRQNASGHSVVSLLRDGTNHSRLVHILIVKHFDPSFDVETRYTHLDGDKSNNHILNLSRYSVPFNAEAGESHETRTGVRVHPTGVVYPSLKKAAAATGAPRTRLFQMAHHHRSFVLNDIRFTQLFA